MTLILSVIAPRWVMQASDRRVVSLDGSGKIVRRDDSRNKAIFVAETTTFAYTGHADIGGDTAEFFQGEMARALGTGEGLDDALRGVGDMTAAYMKALRPETDRHHAFVGVGREAFATYRESLPAVGDRVALFAAGVPVPSSEFATLSAQVAYACGESDDPEPVARILIETIRQVASHNQAVGPGVMVNCLPISPGPPGGDIVFIGQMPALDVRTFTYVSPGEFDGQYLGPLVASSDGGQIRGSTLLSRAA